MNFRLKGMIYVLKSLFYFNCNCCKLTYIFPHKLFIYIILITLTLVMPVLYKCVDVN